MKRTVYKLTALLFVAAGALTARPVYAHGFGERYDLPVPLGYYLVGAGATVALSFVVIGAFVRGSAGVARLLATQLVLEPADFSVAPGRHLHFCREDSCSAPLSPDILGRRPWRPDSKRQLHPHLRVGHLVGGPWLLRGADRQSVGRDEPLEHPVRVGGGVEQALQATLRPGPGLRVSKPPWNVAGLCPVLHLCLAGKRVSPAPPIP